MDAPPLPPARIRLIFSGLALALLLAALDQTVVATALPTIATDLAGFEHVAWVVTAYLSGVAVAMPLSGKLGDIYGRKAVFLVAIVIFLVGSALCGLAQSLDQLVAFRALQGVGGGGLITLTVTMGADIVSPRELGRYTGYFGAAFGGASVLGPLAGGYFTEHLTWRWIFYINLPLGVLCVAVIAAALPTIKRAPRTNRLDYLGAAVLAAAIVCIVLVTSWGGTQYAWRSPTILGLTAGAVAAVVLLIVVERRAADPVLPLDVFRSREFSAATASSFFVGFGLFGAIAFLPLFLQLVQGVSPTNSGLQLLPLMLGLTVTGVASGVAITKIGKYKVYTVFGPLLAAAGMYMLHTTGPSTSRAAITVYMVAVGLGVGLCLQVLVLVAQNTASAESMGVVTSTVTTLRTIGGSVGVAILGAVFSREVARGLTGLGPAGSGLDIPRTSGSTVSTEVIARLPAAVRGRYVDAFTDALTDAFFWTVPAFVAAALVALALRNLPMRQEVTASMGHGPSATNHDERPRLSPNRGDLDD